MNSCSDATPAGDEVSFVWTSAADCFLDCYDTDISTRLCEETCVSYSDYCNGFVIEVTAFLDSLDSERADDGCILLDNPSFLDQNNEACKEEQRVEQSKPALEYLEQIAQMNENLMRKMEAEAQTVLPKPALSLRQIAREESKSVPVQKPEPVVATAESDSAEEEWETTPAVNQKDSSSSEDEWDVTPALTKSSSQVGEELETTHAVKREDAVVRSNSVVPSITVSKEDWSDESDDMWSESPKKESKESPKKNESSTIDSSKPVSSITVSKEDWSDESDDMWSESLSKNELSKKSESSTVDSKPTPSITVSKEDWSDESDDMWSESPKKESKESPKQTIPASTVDSKPTPSITVSKEDWSDESDDMWSETPKESSKKNESSTVDSKPTPTISVSKEDWSDESDDMWSETPKEPSKKNESSTNDSSKPTPSITVSKEDWSDESDDMWSESPKESSKKNESPKKNESSTVDSKPTPSITVSKEDWSDESDDMWSDSPKTATNTIPVHQNPPPIPVQSNDTWSDEETITDKKDSTPILLKPLPKSRRRQRARNGIRGVGKIVNELSKEETPEGTKKDDPSEKTIGLDDANQPRKQDDWSDDNAAWGDEPTKKDDWSDGAIEINEAKPISQASNTSSDPFSFFDFSPVPDKEGTEPKEEEVPKEEDSPREETNSTERIQRVHSLLDSLPDLTFLRNEVYSLPLPHV